MTTEEIRAAEKRGRLSKDNARKRKSHRRINNTNPVNFYRYKPPKGVPSRKIRNRTDVQIFWALRTIFTRKEYVNFDDLPEALKKQIKPFEEFIYP